MSPAPKRRWFRFSLRWLFLVLTLFGVWCGLGIHRANRQKAEFVAVESVDGYFYYDYECVAWLNWSHARIAFKVPSRRLPRR